MNNKGFTLIEIIAVITILALLGVIITINLSDTLKQTKQKKCEEFVKLIEDSACTYAGLSSKKVACNRSSCSPIKLKLLIEEGFIDEETDPCTEKKIDTKKTVTVTWNEDGEKICTYNGVREYAK